MDEHAITHWYCERCQRSGQVEHAPDAGVWQVFVQIIDAHHKAFLCIDPNYIRTWKEQLEEVNAHDRT